MRAAAPADSLRDEPEWPPSGAEEQPMTAATWITMIVVMAFVWGGFLGVLLTAVRKESGKSGDA